MRRRVRCCGFFAARRGLKHPGILRKIDNRAQIFLRSAEVALGSTRVSPVWFRRRAETIFSKGRIA